MDINLLFSSTPENKKVWKIKLLSILLSLIAFVAIYAFSNNTVIGFSAAFIFAGVGAGIGIGKIRTAVELGTLFATVGGLALIALADEDQISIITNTPASALAFASAFISAIAIAIVVAETEENRRSTFNIFSGILQFILLYGGFCIAQHLRITITWL